LIEECRTCKFSKRNEDFSTCRRNPSFITHYHDDWCGEWKENLLKEKEALVENLSIKLPKRKKLKLENIVWSIYNTAAQLPKNVGTNNAIDPLQIIMGNCIQIQELLKEF
jgi:hypothetical protein